MIRIIYILLGIVVLFLPGFLVSLLLYPDPEKLDFWERIAGSIGLSGLINIVFVTILAHPWFHAIRFAPYVVLAFCGLCGVLVYLRENSRETFLDFWNLSES